MSTTTLEKPAPADTNRWYLSAGGGALVSRLLGASENGSPRARPAMVPDVTG